MYEQINKLKPIIIGLVILLFISIAYMAPALSGKNIKQDDITRYIGMSKELVDFRAQTGEEGLWTNSMFGGMPAYLVSTIHPSNKLKSFHNILILNNWRPISFLFLYLLGFYLALLAFDVNRWLSIVGAIAYGLSSYFIIIIVAGHNSKALALGYLPMIIGGVHLAFRGKYLWGALLAGFGLGLQILMSHLQITYYTLIIILVYGIYQLIFAIKDNRIKHLLIAVGSLTIAVIFAVGSNTSNLWTTAEYGEYSIRGASELSINSENKTSGLDKDYATAWSYGKMESLTLLIPNFMGGSSGGELPIKSETFKFLSKVQGRGQAKKAIKQMPTYWGNQPFTSGPVYVGSIVVFLFILGLFIVDKRKRWWLLTATIVSLLLAWGKNFPTLTNFLLDYLPGYNKFRAVSMTLVIAQFTMPLLGILAADKIIKGNYEKKDIVKGLKYSIGITGGLLLFFILFSKSLFNFSAISDERYIAQGATQFVDALQSDRVMLLRKDAFRSLFFVVLAFSTLWLLVQQKIKKEYAILALGLLVLVDMWGVDKRYLNNDNFVSKKEIKEPYSPSQADLFILKDKNPNYRVLNLTSDTFNDAATSYYHKSIGGYHGAKMRRYQELIEHAIYPESRSIITPLQNGDFNVLDSVLASASVLNMLNAKYIIVNPNAQPLVNETALGNAWFVSDYTIVKDANEEILSLNNLDTKNEAIVDARFSDYLSGTNIISDSTATIRLEKYQPNYLKYKSTASSDQFAIFSEIYYPKGWQATIDGEPVEHISANYVLRAMKIPAGEHIIEFRFLPKSYIMGSKVSLVSSLLFILLLLGIVGWELKKQFSDNKE